MGDDSIDTVISHIYMGYLVTLARPCRGLQQELVGRRASRQQVREVLGAPHAAGVARLLHAGHTLHPGAYTRPLFGST
jgi:hypothetical protein